MRNTPQDVLKREYKKFTTHELRQLRDLTYTVTVVESTYIFVVANPDQEKHRKSTNDKVWKHQHVFAFDVVKSFVLGVPRRYKGINMYFAKDSGPKSEIAMILMDMPEYPPCVWNLCEKMFMGNNVPTTIHINTEITFRQNLESIGEWINSRYNVNETLFLEEKT